MRFLIVVGLIIAGIYALVMCYVVVCEIIEAPHPSEDAVVYAFIKIAICYFVVCTVYAIGHYLG